MAIMKGDFSPGPDGTMLVNGIHCYDQAAVNHAASLGRFFAKRKRVVPRPKPLIAAMEPIDFDAIKRADELAKLLDRERERAELEQLDQQIDQWVDPRIGGW
jgi:hypothetical protein